MIDWLARAPGGLAHSLLHRPYVFLPFAAFLFLAVRQLGRWRALRMAAGGYALAWLSELASIHTGFPYGRYEYLHDALEGDLLVLGVPFFDSLSYTFLTYFGWRTATLLGSRVRAPGSAARGPLARLDLRLEERPDVRRGPRVLLLTAFLTTWIDVVVDPVSHLGERWFLGRIYRYPTPGAYFDVPFSNFLGWLFVTAAIGAWYQWIDRRGDAHPARGARELPGQALLGPALYFCIVAFALTMTFALGELHMGLCGVFVQLPVLVWTVFRLRDRDLRVPG